MLLLLYPLRLLLLLLLTIHLCDHLLQSPSEGALRGVIVGVRSIHQGLQVVMRQSTRHSTAHPSSAPRRGAQVVVLSKNSLHDPDLLEEIRVALESEVQITLVHHRAGIGQIGITISGVLQPIRRHAAIKKRLGRQAGIAQILGGEAGFEQLDRPVTGCDELR